MILMHIHYIIIIRAYTDIAIYFFPHILGAIISSDKKNTKNKIYGNQEH